MALLKCDICGGKIAVQAGGKTGVCDSCGAAYTLDRMREIASGVKVSQTGTKEDVEQWRTLLATYLRAYDFDGVEKTVKKMLEASPSDEEANRIYGKLQDWKFYEIKNGILVRYHGQAERTEIPAGVTGIGDEAFNDCKSLISITIPNSVTSIGAGAFSGCAGLTSITIPDGVTGIGASAFSDCTNLTSITIPGSVTSIGDRAFSFCADLTSITISDGVTGIGDSAFRHCSGLTSITIPDSVTSIGEYAFADCTSLTSITISDSVTSIGDGAFYTCTGLTSITIPDIVASIGKHVFADTPCALDWRRQRLCQNCGGKFEGLLSKKCRRCGKPKDY